MNRIIRSVIEKSHLERVVAAERSALQRVIEVASHDLGAPVNRILGYQRILTQDYPVGSTVTPDTVECLEAIGEGANRMQEYLGRLSDLTRVSSCGIVWHDLDLGEAVTRVVADLERAVAES